MIIAFDFPHQIGSVCRTPCAQCHDSEKGIARLSLTDGVSDPQPMFIVRESSYREYLDFCIEHAQGMTNRPVPQHEANQYFYYEVHTD